MIIMPSLLLQKCSQTSKSKDHTECLKLCLQLWKEGNFDMFVREMCFIQSKITYQWTHVSLEQIAKKIIDFMITRRVNGAFRLFSETKSPRILPTYSETTDLFKENYPDSAMKFEDVL